MGFGASGVGPSGFFWGLGSIYKHRIITLGTKTLRLDHIKLIYLMNSHIQVIS